MNEWMKKSMGKVGDDVWNLNLKLIIEETETKTYLFQKDYTLISL